MKSINLTKGYSTLVDDEDYEFANSFKWHACVKGKNIKRCYAVRKQWLPKEKRYKSIYLHRLLLDAPKGMDVDHISGDALDNRRSNLRVCTRSENLQNMTQARYVSFDRARNKYLAYYARKTLEKGSKFINLGRFDTEEAALEAVQMYKNKLAH